MASNPSKPAALPSPESLALIAATLGSGLAGGRGVNKQLVEQAFQLWETAVWFLSSKPNITERCEDWHTADAARIREELGLPKSNLNTPFALQGTKHWPEQFPATFTKFARKVLHAKTTQIALSRIRPYILLELKKQESFKLNCSIERLPDPSPEAIEKAVIAFANHNLGEREWNQAGIECLRLKAKNRSAKASKAATARHESSKGNA